MKETIFTIIATLVAALVGIVMFKSLKERKAINTCSDEDFEAWKQSQVDKVSKAGEERVKACDARIERIADRRKKYQAKMADKEAKAEVKAKSNVGKPATAAA